MKRIIQLLNRHVFNHEKKRVNQRAELLYGYNRYFAELLTVFSNKIVKIKLAE